jgi:ATP-binding cassette subfamily B protein
MAGKTMIIVAHRLSMLAKADRIAVFRGGRIVESGTFEELIERGGTFADLLGAFDGSFSTQSDMTLSSS